MRAESAAKNLFPTSGVGFVLVMLLLSALTATAPAQNLGQEDPLPIQRLMIPLSRLPAELERVKQGVLVQMPRQEFEALVRRAVQAGEAARVSARLVKARYTAELIGNALVQGGGQWTIHHPGQGPTVLPMASFNLALGKMHWSGGGDAVLGNLDGTNLGLVVDKSGDVFFDWTLRGKTNAGGLQFDLQLPPSPVAVLELKVPVNYQLVVNKSVSLLSGPEDAGEANKRIWRLQFSGRAQLEFQVRRPSESQPSATLFLTQLQARQQMTPERLSADYEFNIDALRAGTRELVFDCDATLQPYEVAVRNAELRNWEFKAAPQVKEASGKKGSTPQKSATLVVTLRDPIQDALQGLTIRCLAPAAVGAWISPEIRLRQAQMRSEALKIAIHADVQLDGWDAGSFRLVNSTTDGDGSQVLSLINPASGLEPGRRPTCVFKVGYQDVSARQQDWWHIGPTGAVFTSDIAYELARGKLFQLALKLPAPVNLWRVESVQLEPKDALRSWGTAGQVLLVDLQRGLNPRNPVKLSVRLAMRMESLASTARNLEVPALEPMDATARQGTLAISIDQSYQASLQNISVPLAAPPSEGPWAGLAPQFFFRYQSKAVAGQVRLFPQKARVRVRCQEDLVLARREGTLEARLDLEPVIGTPTSLDLLVTVPPTSKFQWTIVGSPGIVRSLERQPLPEVLPALLLMGPNPPWQRAVLLAQLPRVQHWRLHFASPLIKPERVSLRATLEPRPIPTGRPKALSLKKMPQLLSVPLPVPLPLFWLADNQAAPSSFFQERWDIPLVVVPGADHQHGEITLQPVGIELARVDTVGLDEVSLFAGSKREVAHDVWRVFHYGSSFRDNLPYCQLATREHQAVPSAQEWCDQAHLVTYVQAGEPLLHHFRFNVWNWRQRELVVHLPSGSQKVVAARVDGRWIEQLHQQENNQGWLVHLPAAMGSGGHRFEVFYHSKVSWWGWPPWADLDVTPPELPVAAPTYRRTWRLAPGLVPLHQEHWQPLSDKVGLSQELRGLWHLGDSVLTDVVPLFSDDALEVQRQVLLGAESGLRRKLTRDMSLGEALERLAHDYLKDQLPLLIDRAALRAAEIRIETPLLGATGISSRPFWEPSGLVYVAFPSGAVLTTGTQLKIWQHIYGRLSEVRQAVDPQVAEAIALGQNSRGRLLTLGQWLRSEKKTDYAPAGLFLPGGEGWTVWERQAGQADTGEFLVFQASFLRSLGLLLSVLMLWGAWRIGNRLPAIWCLRLWLLWVLALGLIWQSVPASVRPILWWPGWCCATWSCLWLLRFLVTQTLSRPRASKSTDKAIVVTGVSLIAFLFVPPSWVPVGRGDSPEPPIVFIVDSEPGKQLALVTQDLLKKLGELEMRNAKPTSALLLGARYEGKLKGNQAEFAVQYELHSFGDKTKLWLPLSGVELQEGAYLDGRPVFPVVSPAPKSGYLLDVLGQGSHRLALSFTVRLAAVGNYQEMRFLAPRLCMNQLNWMMPGPAPGLHLVTGFGDEKIRQQGNAVVISANLGREATMHLRWQTNQAAPGPPSLEVREAYFWDLRPGTLSLSGAFQFTPTKGTVSQLTMSLPAEIDVRSVQAVADRALKNVAAESMLKKWYLNGNGADRQLHVELTDPCAGPVLLTLQMVPRINLAPGNVLLKLPVPLGVKQTESFLAYRQEGFEVIDRPFNLGVTAIGSDIFDKAWGATGNKTPGPASRAYSFRRTSGNSGLGLTLNLPRPKVEAAVNWTLYPDHAEMAATIKMTATGEDLSLVEMVPPGGVALVSVRGSAIHHWSRQNNRLQIWLQEPRKQITLELSGWAPLSSKITQAKPGRFVVTMLQIPDVHLETFAVTVQAAPGVIAEPERRGDLLNGGDLGKYVLDNPSRDETFKVHLAPARGEARMLTNVEVRENACILVCSFHCQTPLGSPGPYRIVLKNCPGDDVRLEFPLTAPHIIRTRVGEDHFWDVTLPPNAPQPITFRLLARVPVKDLAKFALPDVTVRGFQVVERWLALSGSELRSKESRGLTPVKDIGQKLRIWPEEAQQLAKEKKVWHIDDPDWRLRLEAPFSGEASPVEVLLAQEQTFLGAGQRWVHQTEFLLAARADIDLRIALPSEARLLALTLDDLPVTPRPAGQEEFLIPLGGAPGPRVLRLRWRFLPPAEAPERPLLGGVHLSGVKNVPLLGRLIVPFGLDIPTLPEGTTSGVMQQLLARARAQLALCRLLANPGSADVTPLLLAAQKSLLWNLRQADLQLSYLTGAADKSKYRDELGFLRQQNELLLAAKGLDGIRNQAEKRPADMPVAGIPQFPIPEEGTALFWQLPDARQQIPVFLLDATSRQGRGARVRSELLILAGVILFLLSFWPRLLTQLVKLWPELYILLGLAGMWAWGISLVGLFLIAAGVIGRLFWVASLLSRLVLRRSSARVVSSE